MKNDDSREIPPLLEFYKAGGPPDAAALAMYEEAYQTLKNVPGFSATWDCFRRNKMPLGYAFEIAFARYLLDKSFRFRMNVPNGKKEYDFLVDDEIAIETTLNHTLINHSRVIEKCIREIRRKGLKGRLEFTSVPKLADIYPDVREMSERIISSLPDEAGDRPLTFRLKNLKGDEFNFEFQPQSERDILVLTNAAQDIPGEESVFGQLWRSLRKEAEQLPTDKLSIIIQNATYGDTHYQSYLVPPVRVPKLFIDQWPLHLKAVVLWECDYDKFIPLRAWVIYHGTLEDGIGKLFEPLGDKFHHVRV